MNEPKAYVTQEMAKLDYAPAEKYGEVIFLVRDDFSSIPSSLNNESLMRAIRHKLQDFREDIDFVVVSGSPVVAAAVFATLGKMGVSVLRVLRWSNRDNHYTPVHIKL